MTHEQKVNQHNIDELRGKGFHIIDGDLAGVGSSDGQITITASPRHEKDDTAYWLLKIRLPNHSQMWAMVYPGDLGPAS